MGPTGQAWLPVAVFALVFGVQSSCSIKTSFDSLWSIPTAVSLLEQGDAALDEYAPTIAQGHAHGIDWVNGRPHGTFPLGVSLIAAACVFVFDTAVETLMPLASISGLTERAAAQWEQSLHARGAVDLGFFATVEMVIASLVVGLAAAVMFLLARLELGTKEALVGAGVFAFCTSAWSTASRALWQHGPSMLMLALTLYLLARAKREPKLACFAALPLAFSYVTRPTNAVSVALVTLYVLVRHRQQLIGYLLCASAIAVPFVAYNLSVYGAVLAPYYQPQRLEAQRHFVEALAGNLVSPARGLLVFTPVLLLCGLGLFLKVKQRRFEALDALVCGAILLHWAAVSSFPHWWAGHSYGPRFMSDMVPYFIYLLFPVIGLAFGPRSRSRAAVAAAFIALASISFAIHLRGASTWAVYGWNDQPINVDHAPQRVWDWGDLQFLRGL